MAQPSATTAGGFVVRRAGTASMLNIMISAGEDSGDLHAANALQALKQTGEAFECFGMGSEKLKAAGAELLVDFGDLSVIGFVDALINYPKFLKRIKLLRTAMHVRRPDLLVLVDFPDFNLKLAKTAKSLGIPVLYYISPKFWAWRAGRLDRLAELVTHMAVIFPFEVQYFEQVGLPVTYVGNPLVDSAVSQFNQQEARAHFGLAKEVCTVGLLPGSREGELNRLLPVMLEAAGLLREQPGKQLQFVLPRAPSLKRPAIDVIVSGQSQRPLVEPTIIDGQACDVMRACDVTICASGTATLEHALIGTPTVMIYKVSGLNYSIMSRLIRISDVGLVNIVAGKRIVPELIQHEATAESICSEVCKLLDSPTVHAQMRADLIAVKQKMGDAGAASKVAVLIQSLAGLQR